MAESTLVRFFKQIAGRAGEGEAGLDGLLEEFDRKLSGLDNLILPAQDSHPRRKFAVTGSTADHFMNTMSVGEKVRLFPKLSRTLRSLSKNGRYYSPGFKPVRGEITDEELDELRQLARKHGAAAVGYARIPSNLIFRGKAVPAEFALVVTTEMNKGKISTAPSYKAVSEVVKSYGDLAKIANVLSDFLRHRGFAAYPGTSLGGLIDYVLLAREAGLGEIGYHGMLISPGVGTRQRINVVYTNISNLPATGQNEHTWVRDLCAMCKKCIRLCPPQAINKDQEPDELGHIACIEYEPCLEKFRADYGCAICLSVCPFSQVGYEAIKQRFRGTKTIN